MYIFACECVYMLNTVCLFLYVQKTVATVHENLEEEKQFRPHLGYVLLFQCKLLFLSIGRILTFRLRTVCVFYTLITLIHVDQKMSTI